jgi:hypothetical protein
LGLKWQGREADHSPPSSAEVKNVGSYASTPQYAFSQGQLYLYLYHPCTRRSPKRFNPLNYSTCNVGISHLPHACYMSHSSQPL